MFNCKEDQKVALSISSSIIDEISKSAKKYQIAVSFGYFELCEKIIYSSQITIDKTGSIINNYRRISSGWKEPYSGPRYKKGTSLRYLILEIKLFP